MLISLGLLNYGISTAFKSVLLDVQSYQVLATPIIQRLGYGSIFLNFSLQDAF